jgi:hypothetical protein
MRIVLPLTPGQKGPRPLLSQYGDRLVCVRYRYEAQPKKRFKTVERLVAECPWEPPGPCRPADTLVDLRIGFAEVDIRERVKQAGGKWNPHRKVWELRYAQVVALKLETRIAEHGASTYRCQK